LWANDVAMTRKDLQKGDYLLESEIVFAKEKPVSIDAGWY